MTYPKAFNHIGLSVPDVDAAFKWYTEVLGFYPIMKPTVITKDDSAIGVLNRKPAVLMERQHEMHGHVSLKTRRAKMVVECSAPSAVDGARACSGLVGSPRRLENDALLSPPDESRLCRD